MSNSSAGKGPTNKAQIPNHLQPERVYKPYSERTLIVAVTTPTEEKWQLYCQEKWDLAKPICLLEEFPDVWDEKCLQTWLATMPP
jgi:hypothetical protein